MASEQTLTNARAVRYLRDRKCLTFAEIGRRFGFSRQYAHQLYAMGFKDLADMTKEK